MSHWVPLSFGLVPHLSKKLSKLPLQNCYLLTLSLHYTLFTFVIYLLFLCDLFILPMWSIHTPFATYSYSFRDLPLCICDLPIFSSWSTHSLFAIYPYTLSDRPTFSLQYTHTSVVVYPLYLGDLSQTPIVIQPLFLCDLSLFPLRSAHIPFLWSARSTSAIYLHCFCDPSTLSLRSIPSPWSITCIPTSLCRQ